MWTSSGGAWERDGKCIISLTIEAGPCSTEYASALLASCSLRPGALLSWILASLFPYSLLFTNSFQFLCPKTTKYLLSKTLQSHCDAPFPHGFQCDLVLPPLSMPHPTPRSSFMLSAPTSIYLLCCYDSAVPTVAKDLPLPGAGIYCLRNFCLEGREERMFMKENYRWNGHK